MTPRSRSALTVAAELRAMVEADQARPAFQEPCPELPRGQTWA